MENGNGHKPPETAVTLPIEGMHCAGCVARVEKTLGGLDGVKKASVDLVSREAWVVYDPALTGPSSMREAVRAIGYAVPEPAAAAAADGMAAAEERRLRTRLAVSIALSAPVVFLSMGSMLGLPLHGRAAGVLLALLSLPVYLWPGWTFHRGALVRLRHGAFDMDSLVSLGTTAAMVFSLIETAVPGLLVTSSSHGPALLYDSAVMIITFVLLGRYLEAGATAGAGRELSKLAALRPSKAHLVRDGGVEDVDVSVPGAGDILIVHPGEAVPLDGVVVEGTSAVDESMVTGESIPVVRLPGLEVIGGTINTSGTLGVRVTKTGERTFLARVIRAVREAQASKPPIQRLADRIASVFVPAVIVVALATFAAWLALGPSPALAYAVTTAVAVLVIACPCALGLATPVAVAVAVGSAAKKGIFVRRGDGFERLRRADVFAFDKTGTLTKGKPEVTDVVPAAGLEEADVVGLAAAIEAGSTHPLGRAISARSRAVGARCPTMTDYKSFPGKGMSAASEEESVLLGSEAFMKENAVDTAPLAARAARLAAEGKSIVHVARGGRVAGIIAVRDPVREEAPEVIRKLKAMGRRTILLTGDAVEAAAAVQRETGIDEVHARLLPEEKSAKIREMQARGLRVAMVGDGVNDAPSLAAADAGSVAMGSGSDVAIETADAGLMGRSLRPLLDLVRLSGKTVRVVRQNFFWAFVYNVLAIPLAAGALFPFWGILLSPMVAAAAMSLSSVSVVLSSLRLRRA
jgi:Cu+-exporting ATPase